MRGRTKRKGNLFRVRSRGIRITGKKLRRKFVISWRKKLWIILIVVMDKRI